MTLIAILTVSDRASRGAYEDLGGPAIEHWLRAAVTNRCDYVRYIVPDGLESLRDRLLEISDRDGADLMLTTGGTGPAPRT